MQSGIAFSFLFQDYLILVGSPRPRIYKVLSVQRATLIKEVGYVVKNTDFDVVKIAAMNRRLPQFISGVHNFHELLDLGLSVFQCHVHVRNKIGVQKVPTSLY